MIMQAGEGMVLARDVETPEGRVLCGKGAVLDMGMVERLKKMGITAITVEGHPVDAESVKPLEQELEEIDRRFSKVQDIPPLQYLQKKLREKVRAVRG